MEKIQSVALLSSTLCLGSSYVTQSPELQHESQPYTIDESYQESFSLKSYGNAPCKKTERTLGTANSSRENSPVETRRSLRERPVTSFDYFFVPFPLKNPTSTCIIKRAISNGVPEGVIKRKMLRNFESVRPTIHDRIPSLIKSFLEYKKKYGSSIEKALYRGMEPCQFVDRLIRKRPASFVGATDVALLRSGGRYEGGWESVGKENEKSPLVLSDYLSYDEMKISALLTLSSLTVFLNNGKLDNRGEPPEDEGEHQKDGIIIGVAGPRLEKPGVMECQEMIITPEQNCPENGYGKENASANSKAAARLKVFADFYGVPYFPTFDEVAKNEVGWGEFEKIGDAYCCKTILKKRIQLTAETILLEANQRGREEKRKAFVRVVGFGLGVWLFRNGREEWSAERKYFLEAFKDAIKKMKLDFVSDVNFIFIDPKSSTIKNGNEINGVKIRFSQDFPHNRLTGKDNGKLLVCVYPWDGNALPGNEFWMKSLTASGDPAAACSTQIAEIHNPYFNEHLSGDKLHVASPSTCEVTPFKNMVA